MEIVEPAAVRQTSFQPWVFGVALIACLVVAIVSRLCFLGEPFQNDAGIYIYLGKLLWTGGRLYQDLWETKLPSVPLLTAPLWGLFGNHWAGYVLVQAAMGIGAAVALAAAMRRFIGPWTFAPALLGGLIVLNLSRINLTGFQLETVQAFFETLAACAVLAGLTREGVGPWFAAGLLAGVAAMAKPTGLAVVAAAGVALLWRAWSSQRGGEWKASLGAVAAMGVGVAVPVIGCVAWVMQSPVRAEMPHVLSEIGLYASGTPWRSLLQLKTWIFFLLPLLPWGIRRLLTRDDPACRRPPIFGIAACFALAWLAAEIVAVVMQRRLYSYHFLVLAPPAVMLLALWPRRGGLFPILLGLAPLALVSVAWSIGPWRALFRAPPKPMTVSQYIIGHTEPTDAVWADPECALLLETGRRPGSQLQMTFYLVNHDAAPAEFGKRLIDDFETRKPVYVVLQVGWNKNVRNLANFTPGLIWRPKRRASYLAAIDRLQDYFDSHYEFETEIDGKRLLRRLP